MRSLRVLLSTSIVLLFTAVPAVAHATPEFPALIQTDLKLTYDLANPPTRCIICHQTNAGGLGTLVGFGLNMKMVGGLMPYADATMQPALDTLQQMNTDSDCNKIPDIQQLKDGRNPSVPGEYIDGSGRANPDDEPAGGCGGPQVLYGCGAQLAAAAPSWEGSAAVVAALGLVLARRRRRSTPPARSTCG